MQWDASVNAGFSKATPWLAVADDYLDVNVAVESANPESLLTLYKKLIALRRAEPALAVGEIALLPADGNLIAYLRKTAGRRLLIILNLGPQRNVFNLSELCSDAKLLLSTISSRPENRFSREIEITGAEGVITELL
jgi:alpha-glucosidase